MIELFKIFSAPIPKGSREYTIHMDVDRGTLLLMNRRGEVVEETNAGFLWCHAVQEIGLTIHRWFGLGYPVETGEAYPAMVRGAEALGFFVQGAAWMAERMARQ